MWTTLVAFLLSLCLVSGDDLDKKDLALRVARLESLTTKLRNELLQQKAMYDGLLNKVASIKTVHRESSVAKRASPNDCAGPVVFHARLTSPIYPIGATQIIQFDSVITNVGTNYDDFTGLFRASIAGVYEFVATMWSNESNHLEIEMVKNGVDFCYGRAGESNQTMAMCTGIIRLEVGDRVWVRHLNGGGTYANGNLFPSFSGHLIV